MDDAETRRPDRGKKIALCRVHEEVHNTPGFSEVGCINSDCRDMCCMHGAEFDRHAHGLVVEHWNRIRPLLRKGIRLEDCFEDKWLDDPEYAGGNAVESKVDPATGYCAFHLPGGKGCALFKLASQGLPRGIVPSICRLFPLTWADRTLMISDKSDIPGTCECVSSKKKRPSLYETQRHAIEEIFELQE